MSRNEKASSASRSVLCGLSLLRVAPLWLFPVLMLLSLVAWPVSQCAGYEFTVQGVVQMQGYHQGRLQGETNYNFRVEVRDCGSRIRVFGGRFSSTEFNEYGWDTTNGYTFIKLLENRAVKTVQYLENGKPTTKELDRAVKSANDGTLTISPSVLPEYGRGIEPVWLAFASHCYYATQKTGSKLQPVWWMGGGVKEGNILFLSEWSQSRNAPYLLESFADFTDGNSYQTVEGKPLPVRMPKPFDEPTTNSIYRVLVWTNVSGMSLPYRFQVVRYAPDVTGPPPRRGVVILEAYEGVSHLVEPFCRVADFAPTVTDAVPVQIVDERVMRELTPNRAIAYFSPTGRVASLEEIRSSEPYRRALAAAIDGSNTHRPRGFPSMVFTVILILSLSIPIWLLAQRNWKPK